MSRAAMWAGMQLIMMYIGSVGFFALGVLLMHDTAPHSPYDGGGSRNEWRLRRRMVGIVFLTAAALALVMALFAQLAVAVTS